MHRLQQPTKFFNYVRAHPPMGPTLTSEEVAGCERILKACGALDFSVAWTAYVLATAYHETAGTMRPLREYGKGRGKKYGGPGRNKGQVPYGRGDVQLTWDANYERADRELKLGGALISNYDLALDPAISARIITLGMREGWFTGATLAKCLPNSPAKLADFNKARTIVNGHDKADLIAGYAMVFQAALLEGDWNADVTG